MDYFGGKRKLIRSVPPVRVRSGRSDSDKPSKTNVETHKSCIDPVNLPLKVDIGSTFLRALKFVCSEGNEIVFLDESTLLWYDAFINVVLGGVI